MSSKSSTGAAIIAAPVAILGLVLGLLLLGGSTANAACGGAAVGATLDPATLPADGIAGYRGAQLSNAAVVIAAARDRQLSVRDQTIGVMTAMGESSLTVLDHGDAAGPDSRGLFQQRDNGAWGTLTDRMDPYTSASNFFRALAAITDRDALAPSTVAHRVQRNADPFYYTRFWAPAVEVVEGLTGLDTGLEDAAAGTGCPAGAATPGTVSSTGWAVPAAGPITSPYGMRTNPVSGIYKLHAGTDLAGAGCGGPIWAAQGGMVTFAGVDSQGNGTVLVDHGGGVQTAYLHMYPSGTLVREGDSVAAGDQIARVGSSGNSTGCHLHFEVRLNGTATDPVPFMTTAGAPLG